MKILLLLLALGPYSALAAGPSEIAFLQSCYSVCGLLLNDPAELTSTAELTLNARGFGIFQESVASNRKLKELGRFDEDLVRQTLELSTRAFIEGQEGVFPAPGLTALESAAIQQYTSEDYKKINSALRSRAPTPEIRAYADFIDSALEKLPVYRGRLKRGMSPFPGWEKVFVEGEPYPELAFLSTSTNLNDHKFDFAGVTMFVESKTGRHIPGISRARSEGEVLFKTGTRFLVKKVDPNAVIDGVKTILIELEEI